MGCDGVEDTTMTGRPKKGWGVYSPFKYSYFFYRPSEFSLMGHALLFLCLQVTPLPMSELFHFAPSGLRCFLWDNETHGRRWPKRNKHCEGSRTREKAANQTIRQKICQSMSLFFTQHSPRWYALGRWVWEPWSIMSWSTRAIRKTSKKLVKHLALLVQTAPIKLPAKKKKKSHRN